jgi:hypothetical protein
MEAKLAIVKRNVIAISAAVAVVCVVAPSVANAQEAAAKPELGLRTGYAIPLGKLSGDATEDMNEAIAGQIPLWLDLGARIRDRVFVGAYFSYGFGILGGDLGDACDAAEEQAEALGADSSCSTTDMRLGAQAHYHFGPPNENHVWLGGGIGYEWWRFGQSVEAGGQEATVSLTGHGFEFLNVQVGGDFPVAEGFALGPFAAFTLAQFGTVSIDCSGDCGTFGSDSESIDEKALHEWLFFGVRGVGVF